MSANSDTHYTYRNVDLTVEFGVFEMRAMIVEACVPEAEVSLVTGVISFSTRPFGNRDIILSNPIATLDLKREGGFWLLDSCLGQPFEIPEQRF